MAAQSENTIWELSLTLDYVRCEMNQLKALFVEANKDFKEHKEKFLQLSRVMETHRKKSIGFEKKVTKLEDELRASKEEVGLCP